MNSEEKKKYPLFDLSNCIRVLCADSVESANSGHPGMPLGMADIMTVLVFDFLKFAPKDPKWFNRDRLVLSAGHGSMLLYAFYYLAGYRNFTLKDIKNFRKIGSKTPGHPEYGAYDAIETTSGPLGQGLANAVGMAIGQKKYQAKLGNDICDYKVYCIVGDGCLMEGISYEAASLAGHLKLNNLVVIFDDNGITIDGKTSLAVSENHLEKFRALGFNVFSADGHDYKQINKAFAAASQSDKPSFIAFKTIIAKGVKDKQGNEKSHGSPLGLDEISYLKRQARFSKGNFDIPEELKKTWETSWLHNKNSYELWQLRYQALSKEDKEFLFDAKFTSHRNYDLSTLKDAEATRASSGKVLARLMKCNEKLIVGSADLSASNNVLNEFSRPISAGDFSGNFIYYGVREHAMGAIMNGLALSGFYPIGATFFVFADYMRPAIRLSAIMGLPVLYIMTHDSIGVGEDGPTHQPVEHLASFRSMPNLRIFRPADFVETLESYELITHRTSGPSMLVLSRQSLKQIRKYDKDNIKNQVSCGGYIISECQNSDNIDIVIFSSGSEIEIAIDTQKILENSGRSVRVVSVPSFELLIAQGKNYLNELKGNAKVQVAIEAGVNFGWSDIIGENGLFFGLEEFGKSGPANKVYESFGLTAKNISSRLINVK